MSTKDNNPFDLEGSYHEESEDEGLEAMQERNGKFRGAYLRNKGADYQSKLPFGTKHLERSKCTGTRAQSSG